MAGSRVDAHLDGRGLVGDIVEGVRADRLGVEAGPADFSNKGTSLTGSRLSQ